MILPKEIAILLASLHLAPMMKFLVVRIKFIFVILSATTLGWMPNNLYQYLSFCHIEDIKKYNVIEPQYQQVSPIYSEKIPISSGFSMMKLDK